MATFTIVPSFSASESSKPRVNTFKAGDGYEQRVTFGIRTDPKEWRLQFTNRTDTERNTILTFFETEKGAGSFDWTPPRGSAGKWVCQEWNLEMKSCNMNTITATFRQVFEA